jgi:hypothetical protein
VSACSVSLKVACWISFATIHLNRRCIVLNTDFDVVVAGGSVSGLLAAKEIAESGCTVKVLEDDLEIGLPERCDGLVSLKGLETCCYQFPRWGEFGG